MSRGRLIAAAVLLVVAGCARAPEGPDAGDDAALRALDAAYVEAWLKTDAAEQKSAVLALFDPDAVVMPAGGYAAVIGRDALAAFWFPSAAPASVTRFEHDIIKVDAAPPLGVVSGRYVLEFAYENAPATLTGHFLLVAGKEGARWRIRRMIWNVDS